MRYVYVFMFFCILFSFGCSHRLDSSLEKVFRLAGSNRHELEQVIKHYSTNPEDSLKLKAAEFLILNMPGKYAEYYEAPWEDVATVNLRWSSSMDKSRVLETYKIGDPVHKEDINHITANYLISNIDLAFQVWEEKPWGKDISFETFCDEILPYRIGTEPLENWRGKILTSFADINKAIKEDSTLTAVEACAKVNDKLPRFRLDKDFSNMSFTQLMATTRGMCDSQATLAAFVMRALGIPVTIDFTPHWKSFGSGHTWNTVCDSAGKHISFMGIETNPYGLHQGNTLQKAKVYRKTYRIHQVTESESINTPSLFQDNLYDVSSEYENMTSVAVPLKYRHEVLGYSVFLTLLYNSEWILTGHGEINVFSDSILFRNIGKDILYLPVYYTNEGQTPASDPFYIDQNGNMHFLTSNSPDSLMSFSSIIQENDMPLNSRMVSGIFESSHDSNFSDTRTIYTILETPKLYNKIVLQQLHSCRYIRYRAPIGNCNVSEIVFYDSSGNELKGNHIGSSGSYNNLGDTGNKAFDGDITTYYDAIDSDNSWTGLDFGEYKKISSIHYSPRILGIGVYEGNEYELFCWTDDGWVSIEKKRATKQTIEFNAPRSALLFLNNNTLKKRGKVFFIREKKIFNYN